MREIDSENIRNALLAVDSSESALTKTGDIVKPNKKRLITPEHIQAEIGEIINLYKIRKFLSGSTYIFQILRSCSSGCLDCRYCPIKNSERENLRTITNLQNIARLPKTNDVIIFGGGVMGPSTSYHLVSL